MYRRLIYGYGGRCMAEIRGNKSIENAAIGWVIERERAAGLGTRQTSATRAQQVTL